MSILVTFLFLSLVGVVTILYNKYTLDINKLTSVNNGIKVYSATGIDNTLYNTNRSIVEIETLPKYVKDAFIAIEDKRFYSHNGYDLKRIIKSSMVNFTNKSKSQGASTISQQLVKNALLTNEKTYSRKIKEIVLSIKMEKQFNKNEILEMYLNTIYFGSNAYGIENASKIYFNKSAKELSINEACCLAGLIKSPALYSPKLHYENAIKRKNLVAKLMFSSGKITKNDYEYVINSPVELSFNNNLDHAYEEESILEACKLLNISERELINRNYQIITFKQDELQTEVIKYNNDIIKQSENITKSSLDSMSIVSNNDGHVLAYYVNSNYNLHNLRRQPASTLKPLAVYLPCLQHNILTPATHILDEPINYNGFVPHNADKIYHGYVSARNALADSLNIPAVKALDYVGVKKAKETLTSLGINISNSDLNLSLALGAVKNGVKLFDLLSAYTTLANNGKYVGLSFVDKILDSNNNTIYDHEDYSQLVVDEESCFLLTDMLKDCAKYGTAKRLEELNLPIASKTGTAGNSKGDTDLYNVTYSTEHTLLTWIADIDKTVLPTGMLSSSQPTDINNNICKYLYKDKQLKDFEVPKTIKKLPYDIAELNNNHIIISPNHNIERYTAYDYFKEGLAPIKTATNDDINLIATIDKTGICIKFNAKKHLTYNLLRKDKNGQSLLNQIKETIGQVEIHDNNVFAFDEIEYYITNNQNEIISSKIKLRPKDFLMNLLNNEIVSSKKKWLV